MSTTYLASTALEEVERAQAELERHLEVRPSGQCVTCGEVEPCSDRRRPPHSPSTDVSHAVDQALRGCARSVEPWRALRRPPGSRGPQPATATRYPQRSRESRLGQAPP